MFKTRGWLGVMWEDPEFLNEERMNQLTIAGAEVQAYLFPHFSIEEPAACQKKRLPMLVEEDSVHFTVSLFHARCWPGYQRTGRQRALLRTTHQACGLINVCVTGRPYSETYLHCNTPCGGQSAGWKHGGLAGLQPWRLRTFLRRTWYLHINQVKVSSAPILRALIRNMWKKNKWMTILFQSSRINYSVDLTLKSLTMLSTRNQACFCCCCCFVCFFKGKHSDLIFLLCLHCCSVLSSVK